MTAVITEVLSAQPSALVFKVRVKVEGLIELINACFSSDGFVDVKEHGFPSDVVIDTGVELQVVDQDTATLYKRGSAAIVKPGMRLHPCPPHVTTIHHRRERAA